VPFSFAFARLNALQAAVRHSNSLSDPFLCLVTQANQKLTAFLNVIWKAMNSKGLNAMPALSKFLILLAMFLSASYAHAFTSLSPVAGNQARVNHLIRFEESISNPTNEPSCEPICEPTKRMDLDAELPNNLSPKKPREVEAILLGSSASCFGFTLNIQTITKKNICRSTVAQTWVFNQNLSSQVKRQTVVNN
jgi:hypothetical protein